PVGTVWSPVQSGVNSVGLPLGTLNPTFLNPANPGQPLPINLVRGLIGFAGEQDITSFTAAGESDYHALQVQLNKRFGRSIVFSSNWTWQKTTTFNRNQFVPDVLTKNVANRKQAVNINFTYNAPSLTKFTGKNALTEGVFDGWHVAGVLAFFSGNPLTVG